MAVLTQEPRTGASTVEYIRLLRLHKSPTAPEVLEYRTIHEHEAVFSKRADVLDAIFVHQDQIREMIAKPRVRSAESGDNPESVHASCEQSANYCSESSD